jgi:hypothetical protein
MKTSFYYKIIASILAVFFFNQAFAQTVSDTYSTETYIDLLDKELSNLDSEQKRNAKKFLKDLEEKWETNYVNSDIKNEFYRSTNLMLEKKSGIPLYFLKYARTVLAMIEDETTDSKIKEWVASFEKVLATEDRTGVSNYLTYSLSLLKSHILYRSRYLTWRIHGDWEIRYDSALIYHFSNSRLVCHEKNDTIEIRSTSGVFNYKSDFWIGEKGLVDWRRAEYNPDEVFAELNDYKIDLNYSEYKADSVIFTNNVFFDEPLIGKIEDKIYASRRGSSAIYPTFVSYNNENRINNLFDGIDFVGTYKIEGANIIGVGNDIQKAYLEVKRDGKPIMRVRSKSFDITQTGVNSDLASMSLYLEEDSIYHGGLSFSYGNRSREFTFIRDSKGIKGAPFFDTYHQLEIISEGAYFDFEKYELTFDMVKGSSKRPAFFVSRNRFSENHYYNVQGMDRIHPLTNLQRYAQDYNSNTFNSINYAEYIGYPYYQVRLQLIDLTRQGFISFDEDKNEVTVLEKSYFYLDAKKDQSDFDVVFFYSNPESKVNARLNLDSLNLRINGVQSITLSDSQNLIIEPGDRAIAGDEFIDVGKNRDFKFDGIITAGRFSYKAHDCTFDYNAFKIDLPQVDSLWFWVPGKPKYEGGFEEIPIKTALIDLSGDILIDHPNNKSGLQEYPEYPIFNSVKDAYAYYDQPYIENGVYTRDRFYYTVHPFVLKPLDRIKTEEIIFEGFLYSGGIFPDIDEPLRVMPDYSLGFNRSLEADGLTAYDGKGQYFQDLSLSTKGLRGEGSLDFLTSTTKAGDFKFYLDSMNVKSDEFYIEPHPTEVEFPRVSGTGVYQHWMPYQDNMEVYSRETPISMYDDETTMTGKMNLRNTGLTGEGKVSFKVAYMTTDFYDFKNMTFDSDSVTFNDGGDLKLNDFAAHTDYNERKVTFTSNSGRSLVEFPKNQYVCYMDEATWFMDKDESYFAKKAATRPEELQGLSDRELIDTQIEGSEFFSVHPDQDSLTFTSVRASFNSRKKKIVAEGVIKILVADAAIFPVDGYVTILQNANMLPLDSAKILANTTTKYHEITNSKVKIHGKKSYQASGYYQYLDLYGHEQSIYFENIRVNPTYQTIASGSILKGSDFTLSPAFSFQGQANLLASRKELEFDGAFKTVTGCITSEDWVDFKGIINPENVLIPVGDTLLAPNGSRKFLGVSSNKTNREVYSLFMEDKQDSRDVVLVSAKGFVKYDFSKSLYEISTNDKLLQKSRPDDYVSYDAQTCEMHAEGSTRFDINTGLFKIDSYSISDIKNKDGEFTVSSAIDFYFSEKAMKEITNMVKDISYDRYNLGTNFYAKVAAHYMGLEAADKYISRIEFGQQRRVPEELQHTIFINEMKMKFQPGSNSYVSKGRISIGGFYDDRVNGNFDGVVEYRENGDLDEVNIYFKIGDHWFFFSYSNNVVSVFSSLAEFNQVILTDMEGKGEKNQLKTEGETGKKTKFKYELSNERKKEAFLARIKPYN